MSTSAILPTPGLVSIVIPSYESERWLPEAVESCINQEYRPIEIIIVDDGSTDDTAGVMENLASRYPDHVQCVRQSNQGAPAARNRGLARARGEYVMFLDADDRLTVGALAVLVSGFSNGAQISYGRAAMIDASGKLMAQRPQDPIAADDFINMLEVSPTTSSVAFRRQVLDSCSWNPELPCAQEFDLLVRCAIHGAKFAFLPSVVSHIRQHPGTSRITNRTSAVLSFILADLTISYRCLLEQAGELNPARNAAVHYKLMTQAIMMYRTGSKAKARNLMRSINRRAVYRSPRFCWLSYHGISIACGLAISHGVWNSRRLLRVCGVLGKGAIV